MSRRLSTLMTSQRRYNRRLKLEGFGLELSQSTRKPPIPTRMKAVPDAPLLVWPWLTMKFSGVPFNSSLEPSYSNAKLPLALPCSHPTIAEMKDSSMMDTTINRASEMYRSVREIML